MIGETFTVIRMGSPTGEYDDQGYEIIGSSSEFNIYECAFAPATLNESEESTGTRVVHPAQGYLPSGTVLLSNDKLRIRDELWQADGGSVQWTSPYDGEGRGVVVALKRAS
jgi:hypothetical protein